MTMNGQWFNFVEEPPRRASWCPLCRQGLLRVTSDGFSLICQGFGSCGSIMPADPEREAA